MCGDLDEDDGGEQAKELYARFLLHAQALLVQQGPSGESRDDLLVYMDKLFADGLSRTVRDGEQIDDAERYARLAAQPLVFARLAGFLAAHLALADDPLRRVIDALMQGYGEAEELEHDHHHGHGHDHHH